MAERLWIEPVENWLPRWPPGTIVRDRRSGLLLVIGGPRRDTIDWGFAGDLFEGDSIYWSFRVRHLDGTDLTDGWWRPPDDLIPMSPLEALAAQSD